MHRLMMIFLSSLVTSLALLCTSAKILDKDINIKNKLFWISYIILTLYTFFSYSLTDNFVRVIIYYALLCIINLFLFKTNTMQSVLVSFITMFILFISEILFMLIITTGAHKSMEEIKRHFFGDLFSNIFISCIVIIIVNISFLKNIFHKLVKNLQFNGSRTILSFSILSLSTVAILLYYIYFEVDLFYASIICIFLIITFALLTLYLFKEKNDNLKLQIEYDLLSENLEEYEKMYQLQRMLNHENKNELSTIRALADHGKKDNKELISYIDSLIDLKLAKKAKWMDVLKLVPEHTLRGLLYYKLSTMEHNNIMIEFDISRQVTTKIFKHISFELNKKICKILGIYLDNAIQAVENLEEKHIKVSIYLSVSDPNILIISVMNNYKGFIEMDRLDEKGYSTKGNGRGLGLAIAKEVLDGEPKLGNQTQIIKNNFVQELKIKL